jgi:hypothetical protein
MNTHCWIEVIYEATQVQSKVDTQGLQAVSSSTLTVKAMVQSPSRGIYKLNDCLRWGDAYTMLGKVIQECVLKEARKYEVSR